MCLAPRALTSDLFESLIQQATVPPFVHMVHSGGSLCVYYAWDVDRTAIGVPGVVQRPPRARREPAGQ